MIIQGMIVENEVKKYADVKDHYSHSARESFHNCGHKFKLERIQQRPSKLGWQAMIGIACGAFIQEFQKTQNLEICSRIFDTELEFQKDKHKLTLSSEDLEELDKEQNLFVGHKRALLYEYANTHLSMLEMVACEYPISISIAGVSMPIVGFIDILAKDMSGKYLIIDNKRRGRKGLQSSDYNQLAFYAIAIQKKFGLDYLPTCRIDCFVMTKVPYIDIAPVEITPTTIGFMFDSFIRMDQALKNGEYKKNPDSFLCSDKFCSFHSECFKEQEETDYLSKITVK